MIEMEINKVLGQMRALSAQIQPPDQARPASGPGGVNFGELLRQSIDSVSEQQAAAEALATRFEAGAADVSVAEVMVSMQKASLSFQAMTEVRNRLVEAYQQVMNMPI
ncbi:Flagellar hook-basal body complex protein FliE [Gammaproteobacteria bacterium]|nr:flagellar hook-basal body complex protein FliE [Gammaproteobacteria bacterium]CAG0938409.1 Flagellar hook-basal body complex protein FliE [Gammaproteobacteria bacterium]